MTKAEKPVFCRPCPACGTADVVEVIDLHDVPVLCNLLFDRREDAVAAPRGDLVMVWCRSCGHLFNRAFDSALINYSAGGYETSLHFSPHFQSYATGLARRLVERYEVGDRQVLEIGCGGGDFLELVCRLGGASGLGFEPSRSDLTTRTIEGGRRMTIIGDYFTADAVSDRTALIVCRHVLEHLLQPNQLLASLAQTLERGPKPVPVLYAEVPNARFTLEDMGIWDLIYEHASYFTQPSLERMFALCGYAILDAGESFGGQYLWIEARAGAVTKVSEQQRAPDLDRLQSAVADFADRYHARVAAWRERLRSILTQGRHVVLWGAGSKGATFLNVLRTGAEVPFIVDLNPHKQGKFIPGTGQRVIAPEILLDHRPDLVIVMNPLYADEIAARLDQLGVQANVEVV